MDFLQEMTVSSYAARDGLHLDPFSIRLTCLGPIAAQVDPSLCSLSTAHLTEKSWDHFLKPLSCQSTTADELCQTLYLGKENPDLNGFFP